MTDLTPPTAARWMAGEHIRQGHAACLDRAGLLVAATEQRLMFAEHPPYVLGHAGEDIPEAAGVYRDGSGLLRVVPDPAITPRSDLAAAALRAAEEQLRNSDRIIKLLVSRLGGQVQFNDAELAALDTRSLVSSCQGLHTVRLRVGP